MKRLLRLSWLIGVLDLARVRSICTTVRRPV
jgi:hypothetical protein